MAFNQAQGLISSDIPRSDFRARARRSSVWASWSILRVPHHDERYREVDVNIAPTRFFIDASPITLRRILLVFAVVAVAISLVACASRPESGFLSPVAVTAAGASDHTLLVATTRERDPRPGTLFNGERSSALDYATITVSIPPKHVPGAIEWATSAPGDPNDDFVVRDAAYLDGDGAFVRALNAQLATRPRGSRKVLVFVHGYNTMFAEGLYRFAQVVHDAKAPAVPVLFTWASRGKLTGYVYDTNSATAARDDFEHTLRLVLASDADQVNVLAHSMGNWVTVETLRQIKISGDLRHTSKFGYVFLAAPDIDLDVFKSQMRRFGKPKKPFYIVLSQDDKALWLSKFIAGGEGRVGADKNVEELAALGATVIDLTDLKATDSSNHDKFAQLAEVAPELRAVLAQGIGSNPGAASVGEAVADNPLGAISTLPITMLGTPIKIVAGQ
jgi:esterase/lipase superfamily enzyme